MLTNCRRSKAATLPLHDVGAPLILDEFLVGPAPSVPAPPYRAPDQTARDRSPRKNDLPEVPAVSPRRSRLRPDGRSDVVVVGNHEPLPTQIKSDAFRRSAEATKKI